MEADITSQAVGLASNTDFSLWSLFLRADFIVKSVILMLIGCSIYSWAVIIEKFRLFKKINLESEEFEEKFWKSKSAESFYNSLPADVENPTALLFKDTMQSLLKAKSKTNLNERMASILEVNIEKQISKIDKGFTFLATVGSTAPFIGLFGTVWGIMNSFQSIAISRNTSLAIVAPGIAEALFATALGLLAAIPAVVAYNKFNNDSKKYYQRFGYIYHPAYKSLYCDNEFMQVASRLNKQTYIDQVIIKHEQHITGIIPIDPLYAINDSYDREDCETYIKRFKLGFP